MRPLPREEMDATRFTRLIEPHLDVLHRLARRLTPTRADAEDLAQEALVRASPTRWTILRPARFNRHAGSGRIEIGEDLRWGFATVSRDDVAQALVQLIDDRNSVGKALTAA